MNLISLGGAERPAGIHCQPATLALSSRLAASPQSDLAGLYNRRIRNSLPDFPASPPLSPLCLCVSFVTQWGPHRPKDDLHRSPPRHRRASWVVRFRNTETQRHGVSCIRDRLEMTQVPSESSVSLCFLRHPVGSERPQRRPAPLSATPSTGVVGRSVSKHRDAETRSFLHPRQA